MFCLCVHIRFLLAISASVVFSQQQDINDYKERIITDHDIIFSNEGVAIYLSYTETSSDTDQLTSVPGCPKSIDGYPWILHAPPNTSQSTSGQKYRCYLAGYQGPCQPDYVLYAQQGSEYGICSCECNVNSDVSVPSLPYNETYNMCSNGFQVFDKENKSICYTLNEQGPCLAGEVLSFIDSRTSGGAGNLLKCLPMCDLDDPKWERKEEKGECGVLGLRSYVISVSSGVAPGSIQANQCDGSERYSKVLQKCVKRFRNNALILG